MVAKSKIIPCSSDSIIESRFDLPDVNNFIDFWDVSGGLPNVSILGNLWLYSGK